LVSIVIPCFNEAGSIAMLADALWPPLEKIPELDWEVICIDDGSTDSTLQELIALSRRDERFRVLELSRNFGKEAALTAGLDMARGDAVIPMDADLQDPPALIEQMVSAWDDGAEVVLRGAATAHPTAY
jgi:glycosyltransferase involved in cell wall biosynthesis